MQLVDTHCHLDFNHYDADRAQVIARAQAAGVWRIVNPGIDAETSRAAIELAAQYESVYAAAGIHPNSSAGFTPGDIDAIGELARSAKVVAIGEIGLDYYRQRSPHGEQRRAFDAQLALAVELQLPIIIHSRDAGADVIDLLVRWVKVLPDPPGVFHSFGEDWHAAKRALELGFYLGFTGPITYKNADQMRAVAAQAPAGRIVVETDGPFLTPHPHRGERNEPAYVRFTADRLGAVRGVSLDEIAAQTRANAYALFGWHD
ncbi:MAG: TatD family hydrolase [Anaerolineae bacterium]|nr:TatD family hydrolase [Anaerolineae bacterium]